MTLWSPEHPNLVDADLTLLDGETVIDHVESYAGLRSCGRGERPVHAQRPPVLHPDGARAGLLAGVAPGRAKRRCAPRARWS